VICIFYARWLKRKRLKANYTQTFVANYLNVSRETVSCWERGKGRPNYECLRNIFNLYRCSDKEIAQFINMRDD